MSYWKNLLQRISVKIFLIELTHQVLKKESEIRRGAYPGRLTSYIDTCASDELFIKLCPVTYDQAVRRERFELLLRFFAYANSYQEFDHAVKEFLDEFLIKNQETFDEVAYTTEFNNVLRFVEKNFPFGFAKTKTSKITPRVRFEAISVGVALALREHPNLKISNVDWLKSDKFKDLTTSDASNNQGKLKERVEYVRDQLLKDALPDE